MNGDPIAPWLRFFLLGDVNVRLVLMGCMMLGLCAGILGCFTFLRKRALLGDALAHAALPGVCGAFLLSGSKDPFVILAGAMVSCWLGAGAIELIVRYTRCKEESALGMVLSVFFGIGILMLTHIQQTGAASQAGLDKFLFGQAASLLDRDVYVFAVLSLIILGIAFALYKEFKLLSFDPEFSRALGKPTRFIEFVLATLIVAAVGIGLQAVGVVLMAAMLVTPAASARYWTDRLSIMLLLSGVIGAVSGALGAYVSYLSPQMPTGPWMVVAATILFGLSLLFAPNRGAVSRVVRRYRFQRKTRDENLLRTLYRFGEERKDWSRAFATGDLLRYRPMAAITLERALKRLQEAGLVDETDKSFFRLTAPGLARAERLTRLHRLWELYLTQQLELAPDHVHEDAEEIEHILTPELEERLLTILEGAEADPHARPIPGVSAGV